MNATTVVAGTGDRKGSIGSHTAASVRVKALSATDPCDRVS